jgi:hypothetical protein
MTQEEIIEMVEQAKLDRLPPDEYCRVEYWTVIFDDLEALIKLAAAKEREAIAFKFKNHWAGEYSDDEIYEAIIKRGQA